MSGQLNRSAPRAAVILAGGSGTRLWPLSRSKKPKQFQALPGGSLLRLTFERLAQHVDPSHIYVSTTTALRQAVLDSGCDVDESRLILESSPAGPATAFALAAARVRQDLGDVPTLICPSDHHFTDEDAVRTAIGRMFDTDTGADVRPVVMGVHAEAPNSRLGYLRSDGQMSGGAYDIVEIREKPSVAVAEALVEEGRWYWNTACYLVRPEATIATYRQSHPETVEDILRATAEGRSYDGAVIPGHELVPFFDAGSFPRLIPLARGWSDVGSWENFLTASETTEESESEAIEFASRRTTVFGETDQKVVTIGTGDLVVIVHDDAVFVVDRNSMMDPEVILQSRKMIVSQGMENLL